MRISEKRYLHVPKVAHDTTSSKVKEINSISAGWTKKTRNSEGLMLMQCTYWGLQRLETKY